MATGLRKGAKLNYKLMNEQGISLDTKDNSDNNDDQVAQDTRKDSVFSPVKSKAQQSNASSAEDDGKHSFPEEVDSDDQEIEKLQRELETLEKDEAKFRKIKQKEELRQKVVRKRDEVNALRVKDGVLPQITQIAAVELQSGEQFNTYVKPTVPISMAATTVTGISFYNEEMTVNGTKVQSVSIKTAMDEFVNWISKFKSVCLVAHNGRRFDFPILVSTLKNIGAQDKLSECAFIDSMSVFRKLYPNTSLKQVDLVSSLLGETYDAHNAMGDVVALGKLIKFVNLSSNDLMAHSFTQSAIANNMAFNKSKTLNLPSLNPLIYSGVIKKPTAENIAGSGLNINHLKLLHTRGGEDALKDVFISKNSEGLPRVSNNKKVLEEIVPQIAKYFENH